MTRGSAILIAGCAAAAVLPATAFGLNLPLWLDAAASLGVFSGVYLLSRRPAPAGGLDPDAVAEAQSQTARSLVGEAAAALDRLKRAGGAVRDPAMRDQIAALARTGEQVVAGVRADPAKAMPVRRLLTFYLPTAASLAEGWRALEAQRTPAADRASQTRETMCALNKAFAQFADEMTAPQMQTLDLDLKVLNDALKSDLEARP